MKFVLRSTANTIGEHGIHWGGKTLSDIDDFRHVLGVFGAKDCLVLKIK